VRDQGRLHRSSAPLRSGQARGSSQFRGGLGVKIEEDTQREVILPPPPRHAGPGVCPGHQVIGALVVPGGDQENAQAVIAGIRLRLGELAVR
jgi:hypothetical protein